MHPVTVNGHPAVSTTIVPITPEASHWLHHPNEGARAAFITSLLVGARQAAAQRGIEPR